MSSTSRQAVDPDQGLTVSRELLAQMDDAATSREHWKILITSGMGFFTDAYDLFIIGVVAVMIKTEWHITSSEKSLLSSVALLTAAAGAITASSAAALGVAASRGVRPPSA
jgi:MFS transporter, PHS family, inorganic phosphate transporter